MKTVSALLALATITILGGFLLGRPKLSVGADQPRESLDAKSSEESMEQQIVAKEREGLEALKRGDVERFGNLTADDAVFVDAQGPASKTEVLKNVAGFKLTEYSMEDVRFVPVSANAGLISYRINEKGVSHGKEFEGQAYVSSIWIEQGKKWACLFSQETAAR